MDRQYRRMRYSRDERVRKAFRMLTEGLKAYIQSGEWKQILRAMKLFHKYSFHNTMLILMQKPDATLVAGYHTWKRLGRHVKKGEKGILILAPILKKVTKKRIVEEFDEELNQYVEREVVETFEVLAGFKPVYVFDVSQTEGKPIEYLKFKKLNVEDPEMLVMLTDVANEIVSSVIFREITEYPYAGYYDPRNDEIHVDVRYSTADQGATLIHEMGHALIIKSGIELNRVEHEIVAESIDFIVMDYLGYDTSGLTFPYVSRYIETEENLKRLMELGEVIKDTAGRIIELIEKVEKERAEVSP